MTNPDVALTPEDLHRLRGRLHVVLGYAELCGEAEDVAAARSHGSRVALAAAEALDVLDEASRRPG